MLWWCLFLANVVRLYVKDVNILLDITFFLRYFDLHIISRKPYRVSLDLFNSHQCSCAQLESDCCRYGGCIEASSFLLYQLVFLSTWICLLLASVHVLHSIAIRLRITILARCNVKKMNVIPQRIHQGIPPNVIRQQWAHQVAKSYIDDQCMSNVDSLDHANSLWHVPNVRAHDDICSRRKRCIIILVTTTVLLCAWAWELSSKEDCDCLG